MCVISVSMLTLVCPSALGAPKDVKFQSCNMDINRNFLFTGDAMRETSLLMVPLVDEGIRLLIYAGVQDLMCNCKLRSNSAGMCN
jgi:carboxypeptidase C (cathepsin A)